MSRPLVVGAALLAVGLATSGCGGNDGASPAASTVPAATAAPATTANLPAATLPPAATSPTTGPTFSSTTVAPSSTAAPSTASTTPPTTSTSRPTTTTRRSPSTTSASGRTGAARVFPIAGHASYGRTHHDYPATDIFAACGTTIVAPVAGTITQVRTVDHWVRSVDNPATRGGKSFTLTGVDGVRYYGSHLAALRAGLGTGTTLAAGDPIGTVGDTGDASACHLHFGLSLPCPGLEWSVRRGVIWPWRYLDAWRAGTDLGPLAELQQWSSAHPDACAAAMADPHAKDA